MVRTALRTVRAQRAKVQEQDPEAVKAVTEALVLTGIAMSFVGNSRPASGCEHHCAHYWEMKALMEGKTPALHGTQVGVGMILALKLYHRLASEQPDFDAAMRRQYDQEAWAQRMRDLYGAAADGIIALEAKAGKNDITRRNERLAVMKEKWEEIRRTIGEDLPATEEMAGLLRSLGAPTAPEEIDIPAERAREAVIAAKEVRDRYTLLQMLWDLGLAESFAEEMV
jgi:glycerol-1-phosphate dehydrogenase [NAD(P)+]